MADGIRRHGVGRTGPVRRVIRPHGRCQGAAVGLHMGCLSRWPVTARRGRHALPNRVGRTGPVRRVIRPHGRCQGAAVGLHMGCLSRWPVTARRGRHALPNAASRRAATPYRNAASRRGRHALPNHRNTLRVRLIFSSPWILDVGHSIRPRFSISNSQRSMSKAQGKRKAPRGRAQREQRVRCGGPLHERGASASEYGKIRRIPNWYGTAGRGNVEPELRGVICNSS